MQSFFLWSYIVCGIVPSPKSIDSCMTILITSWQVVPKLLGRHFASFVSSITRSRANRQSCPIYLFHPIVVALVKGNPLSERERGNWGSGRWGGQAYPVSISVSLIVAASARVVSKGVNSIFMTLNKQLTRRLSNMAKTMSEWHRDRVRDRA